MRAALCVVVVVVALVASQGVAYADEIIDFSDGTTSTGVGSFYNSLGMTSPNLRFHDATAFGHAAFPFVDDWGAVIDFGVLDIHVGFINFSEAVDFVEIDAFLQYSEASVWSITAFDAYGSEVDFVSAQATTDAGDGFLSSTLRVEATGMIWSIEIGPNVVIGLDTIAFGPSIGSGSNPVPEPGTLALLGLGLFGVALTRRRRSARAS